MPALRPRVSAPLARTPRDPHRGDRREHAQQSHEPRHCGDRHRGPRLADSAPPQHDRCHARTHPGQQSDCDEHPRDVPLAPDGHLVHQERASADADQLPYDEQRPSSRGPHHRSRDAGRPIDVGLPSEITHNAPMVHLRRIMPTGRVPLRGAAGWCVRACGGGGIRTHGELPHGGFQDRCPRPLGDPARAPAGGAGHIIAHPPHHRLPGHGHSKAGSPTDHHGTRRGDTVSPRGPGHAHPRRAADPHGPHGHARPPGDGSRPAGPARRRGRAHRPARRPDQPAGHRPPHRHVDVVRRACPARDELGRQQLPGVHPGRSDQGRPAVRHARVGCVDPGDLGAGGGRGDRCREPGAALAGRPRRPLAASSSPAARRATSRRSP